MQRVIDTIIGAEVDAFGLQCGGIFGRDLAAVHKESAAVLFHERIADDAGRIVHIRAANVQEPAYLVQSGNEQGLSVFVFEHLTDAGEFAFYRFAGIAVLIDIERVHRYVGAVVRPDGAYEVAGGQR